MLGIITLAVFIIFFRFSITLSKWLTYRLKCPPAVVFFTRVAIVVGVAHLMVIDEHIGKYQIDRLCKSHGLRNTDLSKAYGKSVTRNVVGGIRVKIWPYPQWNIRLPYSMRKRMKSSRNFLTIFHQEGGWPDIRLLAWVTDIPCLKRILIIR